MTSSTGAPRIRRRVVAPSQPSTSETARIIPPSPPPPPPRPRRWIQGLEERDLDTFRQGIEERLREIEEKHNLSNYTVLYLFDDVDDITAYHSDQLYRAARNSADLNQDILLVVHSRGGRVEPAYVASKTLKRLTAGKFAVAVPRKAKSAATLLSLGADEIHLGMISELGPIDPQIGGMPALALANALEVIADLTGRYPASADVFGKYISDQAPLNVLGYFKRVTESASQYAERLLSGKTVGSQYTVETVANHLVNHYKDHSFFIDYEEARELLGDGIIKENTPEYKLADEIYEFLAGVERRCAANKIDFWVIGAATGAGWRLPQLDS